MGEKVKAGVVGTPALITLATSRVAVRLIRTRLAAAPTVTIVVSASNDTARGAGNAAKTLHKAWRWRRSGADAYRLVRLAGMVKNESKKRAIAIRLHGVLEMATKQYQSRYENGRTWPTYRKGYESIHDYL